MAMTVRAWHGAGAACLGVAVAAGLTGCDAVVESGVTETEEREIGEVSAVEVSTAVTVTLTTGEPARAVVEADSSVVDRIEVETDADGTLRIGISDGSPIRQLSEARVDVTLPPDAQLDRVVAGGATTLTTSETLTAEAFTVDAGGASEVVMPVATGELVVDLDGASTVDLTGEAAGAEVTVSGASEAQLDSLRLTDAVVTAGGASQATVEVTNSLTAQADGASTIRYVGEPERLDADADLTSEIEQASGE